MVNVQLADNVTVWTLADESDSVFVAPLLPTADDFSTVTGRRATASVPLVMFAADVVSVVADVARPDTAAAAIAMVVEPAAVSRPSAPTVKVATLDADP
jgi:hypothetical protein